MTDSPSGDSWSEWSRYVLKELERLNEQYQKLDGRMDDVVKRLIKLERLAWVLGGCFAFLSPVLVWAAIEFVKSLIS